MRRIDSPGERRALAEPDASGAMDAAAHRADRDPAAAESAEASADWPADGAPADAPAGRPDDLRQRLEALRASHPSSPGYGGREAAAWPPRGGDPYRPWFSAGDPAEPWFTADPGDPPG